MLTRMPSVIESIEEFFRKGEMYKDRLSFNFPKASLIEKENGLVLEIDIPGVKKEDVDIFIEDNMLVIKGERKSEKNSTVYREVSYGSFERRFSVPKNIEAEKIEANFEDGVLKINIPKIDKLENSKKILIK